jgi:flagellar biosynthesis/type III secretory pathway chaperone
METDSLAKLIDQKHVVLVKLRELSARQQQFAKLEGDMSPLLSLLSVKQQLIQKLMDIEQHLTPFRQQDPEARVWRRPEDRQRCAAVAAECRLLLDDLMKAEQQATQLLTERRDGVSGQLHAAAAATQARDAYGTTTNAPLSSLDLSSET